MSRLHRNITLALIPLFMLLAHADASAGTPPPSLDVPLTIHEVAGVDRRQDICSTGVPLPCGLLREPEGIAVFDPSGKAVPAQFRVLERWRDQGEGKGDLSIRWLLVTFLADVPAGGKSVYRLKAGQNPLPAKPVKVEDKGDAWEMGGLAFSKDFSRPFPLVLTDPDDKTITAAELPVTWTVWEAGPVRACLKAESPTVPGKFGFIAWIYAYAGQNRWDMTLVLKNTPNEMQGPLYFKDFSVVWEPAEIKGAEDFLLGGQWGKATAGKLDGGQSVYLHQDSDGTDQWNTFGKDWRMSPVLDWTDDKSKAKAGLPAFRGYRVDGGREGTRRGRFRRRLGGSHADSTPRPSPPCATTTSSTRRRPRWRPAGSSCGCGRSTPSPSAGCIGWTTAPANGTTSRSASAPRRSRPRRPKPRAGHWTSRSLAHPPAEWYYAAGALSRSPEHAREKEFPGGAVKAQIGTGRNWVNFGGDVTDQIRRRYHGADLGGFARTGDPAQAYHLYNMGRHSSGMTPLWLDDYQYPRDVEKLTHAQYCGLAREPGKYRPGTWHHGYMTWNDAHFCCQEVFDNWRLFGDPLALDALTTIGRWCQAYVDFREAHPDQLIAGTRADGLPLHNLCEAYRILGDESMRKSLRSLRRRLLASRSTRSAATTG